MGYMRDSAGNRLDAWPIQSLVIPPRASFVAGSPGVRRVTRPYGAPSGTPHVAAVLDYNERIVDVLPVDATRFRFRIGNRRVGNTDSILTTPVTLPNGIYMGPPKVGANNRWDYTCTAAMTQVVTGAITVPVDGTDYVSPWVTPAAFALLRGTPYLASFGFTSANSGTGIGAGAACQAGLITASGSSQAGVQSPAGITIVTNPGVLLDIRLEYETQNVAPVVCVIGDSICEGVSDGDILLSAPGTCPYEAWPGQAALKGGFNVANLGIASTGGAAWASLSAGAWTRADLATTVPDIFVLSIGTNDLGNAAPATTITAAAAQGGIAQILTNIRTIAPNAKIYLATINPRSDLTTVYGGVLTSDVAIGATSLPVSFNPGNSLVLVDSGRFQEQALVSGVAGSSSPFTLTVPAIAKPHSAGTPVCFSREANRRVLNDWVGSNILGVTGVIDFDSIMATTPGNVMPDRRLMSQDLLHPLRYGYQRMAAFAAPLLKI